MVLTLLNPNMKSELHENGPKSCKNILKIVRFPAKMVPYWYHILTSMVPELLTTRKTNIFLKFSFWKK